MKERKRLKSKGRQKQTRTLTSASSATTLEANYKSQKTIVVTGQVQEILTHIKNGDKHTRDTEQFTLVKPKKRMTTL